MHAARGCAQQLLLPASAGIFGGVGSSEAARPDVHRPPSLRQPPAAGGVVAGGPFDRPPTPPAADAESSGCGRSGRSGTPSVIPSTRSIRTFCAAKRSTSRTRACPRESGVWAADITYIPMRQGFLYLIAIIDWATRRVLSWRLSNTLTAGFCVEALSEALGRFGKPGIFNTEVDPLPWSPSGF